MPTWANGMGAVDCIATKAGPPTVVEAVVRGVPHARLESRRVAIALFRASCLFFCLICASCWIMAPYFLCKGSTFNSSDSSDGSNNGSNENDDDKDISMALPMTVALRGVHLVRSRVVCCTRWRGEVRSFQHEPCQGRGPFL